LYVNASGSSRLIPIDPFTGTPGKPIPVDAPYNLYFTPDGHWAVVMAERRNRIDFYNPTTWKLEHSTKLSCDGPNHADWSIDGRYFLATCEFSGTILKVDTRTGDVLGMLTMPKGSMPQDLRLVPDASRFIVADMHANGFWEIDGEHLTLGPLHKTGAGTHGIYPSRDGSKLYVTNRGEGSVSVINAATLGIETTWRIPGGGSPDMGGLNADGTVLWLSGRYSDEVYAFDTATGALKFRIKVPAGPHGLAVYPQPGRYSLGHTGNFR
jgi:YVTN family beta-propeller protein